MRTWVVLLGAAGLTIPSRTAAQRPVTLREAIGAARAYPNPSGAGAHA
jgi:hypothetical protein